MPRISFQLLLLLAIGSAGCVIRREALEGLEDMADAGAPLDVGEGVDAFARADADRDANVSPNADAPFCGDGTRSPSESCDDANSADGDGCTAMCVVEPGFDCASGTCTPRCGDGIVVGGEGCDDMNGTAGDGCSAMCVVERGFRCGGAPSVCALVCGDGIQISPEACDDGGSAAGDGCSSTCTIESGFTCVGSPSVCTAACGDGVVGSAEVCDDGNRNPGDGCTMCAVDAGFYCAGAPSVCNRCGNLVVDMGETCDDGMRGAGDGCSATCQTEAGATCVGGGLVPQCSFPLAFDAGGVAIPDNAVLTRMFSGALPPSCSPNRVRYVSVNLRHPFLADLIVSITNPSGASVELFNRARRSMAGEDRDLDGAYRFFSNDTATLFPGTGTGAVPAADYNTINGSGGRTAVLRTFMGASGMWTVRVEDAASNDVGILRNVEIGVYCNPNP